MDKTCSVLTGGAMKGVGLMNPVYHPIQVEMLGYPSFAIDVNNLLINKAKSTLQSFLNSYLITYLVLNYRDPEN
jgi:hypothetical protein